MGHSHNPLSAVIARVFLAITLLYISRPDPAAAQPSSNTPIAVPGPNTNMVSGKSFVIDPLTKKVLPEGDPYLQRQNEPSGSPSTRNPLHLLAGANDYRTVDLPFGGIANDEEEAKGDAWLGLFKSFDGGQSWYSTLLPGYPQDDSPAGVASPIHGYQAGADAMVRAGTNGMFYYSGIAFNRGANGLGAVFVARLIDNNNLSGRDKLTGRFNDPIQYLDTRIIDSGTKGQFIDKPALAVDSPRAGATNCNIRTATGPGGKSSTQTFPGGIAYLAYVNFVGNTKNPSSRLMLSRSLDCGAIWSRPIKVSESVHINQGVTIAINPVNGNVHLAWRDFTSLNAQVRIYSTRSTDGGKTFAPPMVVASYWPFDQGGTETSFRTNAYPTMTVDNSGRVYLAWTQRPAQNTPTNGPVGVAKIVITTSPDGLVWSTPKIAETERLICIGTDDARLSPQTGIPTRQYCGPEDVPTKATRIPARNAHQIMPSITAVGGRISLLYYDFGDDLSRETAAQFIQDKPKPLLPSRHTVDVRIIQAAPAADPIFGPSVRVSQYLTGYTEKPSGGTKPPLRQLQYNPPNLALYSQGLRAFIGDYIELAGVPFTKRNGQWVHNTLGDGPKELYAFWTDNREVRPPKDGNWKNYTAPKIVLTMPGAQTWGQCTVGQAGMRNANIYSSRITPGLFVGAPDNSKPLFADPDLQRSFVVFAQNNTGQMKLFRMSIANQPAGGTASFLQFEMPPLLFPLQTVDVTVAPKSSASRTVYVKSTSSAASVTVNVIELDLASKEPKAGGLSGSTILNPDVTNPDVTNPDVTNPDVTNEVFNPDVTNPDVTNPDVTNPDVTNPDVTNPDVTNIVVANPDVTNPDVTNPDVTNPDVTNPDVTNPDVTNTTLENGSMVDVSWKVKNEGDTDGSFAIKSFLNKAFPGSLIKQLIVHRIYTTPVVDPTTLDCEVKSQTQNVLVANIRDPKLSEVLTPDVTNPDVTNPDVTNATVSLAPGESAQVTLRVTAPEEVPTVEKTVTLSTGEIETVEVPAIFDPVQSTTTGLVSYAVSTVDVQQGITTPPFAIQLVIATTTLQPGAATRPYFSILKAFGGEGALTWSIVPSNIVGGTEADYCPSVGGVPQLPAGLSLDAASGLIYGTPTALAVTGPMGCKFTVKVTNAAQDYNIAELTLIIAAAPTMLTTSEDAAVITTITAFGNDANLITFAAIPPSVLHGTAAIQGDPFGPDASVLYAPASNYNGGDSLTFTATLQNTADFPFGPFHAGGTQALVVYPVNDTPSATPQPSVSTNEDTAKLITLTGTDVETANANLTFAILPGSGPSHGTLSGTPPNITYTPAASYNGPDSFQFRVTDRGDPDNCTDPQSAVCDDTPLTSAASTIVITVVAINDAPSFTKGPNQTVLEDAAAQTVANWATAISPGPANESSQLVDFLVSNDNNALFAVQPVISPTGTLTYTVAANVNGAATVTVRLHDNGGIEFGGIDTSAPETFTITVTPVNDVPLFTKGADQSVPEDAGTQTVAAWATGISAGPANESSQILNFNVSNNNTSLFTSTGQPAISPAGTLTYTPAPNATGVAMVTVTLHDNGGTANGGVDTTAPSTFTITVADMNDPPSFVKGADQTVTEDSGARTVPNWATSISPGPANESGQTVDFVIVSNTNAALFSVQPAVSPTGTLTFTPAANAFGTATIALHLHDNGGTANGGVDTSSPDATFTITVTAVNDAPVANNDGPYTVDQGGTLTIAAPGVLANDTDVENNSLTAAKLTNPAHGTVTLNANGSFTYVHDGTATTSDSFTYRVCDNGTSGTPSVPDPKCSAAATVSIGFAGGTFANLSLDKSHAPASPSFGQPLTYTIAVTNAGPDPANGVTVTDPLPASVSYVSANASQGTCNQASGTVTCSIGTLANGGKAMVTIVVTPNAAVPVSNTATVSSTTNDPDNSNNSDTDLAVVGYGPCVVPTFHMTIPDENQAGATFSATGDFNKDGHLDVAVSDATFGLVSVFLADVANPGSFNHTDYPVGGSPSGSPGGLVVRDFDGDTHLDIAVAVSGGSLGNRIALLKGSASGAFTLSASTTTVSAAPLFPEAADFNGDGRPDVAVGVNGGTSVSVLLWNAAASQFASPVAYPSGPSSGVNIIIEDFDGNNKLDIATPNVGVNSFTILSGNGDGTFAAIGNGSVTLTLPYNINRLRKVGDVNGDGRPDLAATLRVSNSTSLQNLALLYHTVDPGFAFGAPQEVLPESYVIGAVALGDVTGDGKPDLVAGSFSTGLASVLVLPGDGVGNFGTPAQFQNGQLQNFEIVDVNGDGRADVIGPGPVTDTFYVLQNTCGTPTRSDLLLTMSGPTTAAAGSNVTYTLTVTNNGTDTANAAGHPYGLVVLDHFGTDQFMSATSTSFVCFQQDSNVACFLGTADATGDVAQGTALAPGASASIDLTVKVLSGAHTNRATVTAFEADPNNANSNASVTTTAAAAAVTFVVTNTDTSGPGSLRQAILGSNANVGPPGVPNIISFNIPAGPFTIAPTFAEPLPNINTPVVIDGTTQQAFMGTPCAANAACPPIIELSGVNVPGATGLNILAGASTVRGLAINRFTGGNGAIALSTAGGNVIAGNYIGTDLAGTAAAANARGINVLSPNNIIGGTTVAERNVITGNSQIGIFIGRATGGGLAPVDGQGTVIKGNYIGLKADGTGGVSNAATGVVVNAANVIVGGPTAAERNVISGNFGNAVNVGVQVFNGSVVANGNGTTVEGNYIGTNPAGTAAIGNTANAVVVTTQNVTIRGNLISGNTNFGIDVAALITGGVKFSDGVNATIKGNFIGTSAGGAAPALPNSRGISIAAPNVRVGGTAASDRNVISGNSGLGIFIGTQLSGGILSVGSGAVIEGNYIGPNAAVTAALPNGGGGISVTGSSTTGGTVTGLKIGGTASGAGNLISGNASNGISINTFVSGAVIEGNLIGTNANGTAAMSNSSQGVSISSSGHTVGPNNVISGNIANGVLISASTNVVKGNYIGTTADGLQALGNGIGTNSHGVTISGGTGSTIGGATPADRNIISGNVGRGVGLNGGSGNLVVGNYIGTDKNGTAALGNGVGPAGGGTSSNIGIDSPNNKIEGNVVSAGFSHGININNTTSSGNTFERNLIGTDVTGTLPLGNAGAGINLIASNNVVGGIPGNGNTIAFNSGGGVTVQGGTGHKIRANSIFSNTGLGIDLFPSGVTANDAGDGDTGNNNLQNFPVLNAASSSSTATTVSGTLNSTPSTTFDIDIYRNSTNIGCDPSGNGEGSLFLGSIQVTTDGSGSASFSNTFAVGSSTVGWTLTATATDPGGSTSEFSQCRSVVANQSPTANAQNVSTDEDTNQPITLTGSDPDNSALTYTVTAQPTHGTLSGTAPNVTYAPAANYNGSDSFKFKVNDGTFDSNEATISITVVSVNDAPDAVNDSDTTAEDTPRTIGVLANDTDVENNSLTISAVGTPAHGTVQINGANIDYTPAANFFGADSFTYTVSDGLGGSDIATVSVTVTPVNDAPTAVNDAAAAYAGSGVHINVVGNDTDPDNSAAGSIVVSESFIPAGLGMNVGFAAEIAQIPGYTYVSSARGVAVIGNNQVIKTIDVAKFGLGAANMHVVNSATSRVYFKGNTALVAIDPGPNDVVARLQAGSLQSMAIDETRGLLYLTNNTFGPEVAQQARITIVDVNPANPTYHQVLEHVVLGSAGSFTRGIAVDSANNRVFVAVDSNLVRIDNASLATRSMQQFSIGVAPFDLALFGSRVYGYGGGGRMLAYDPSTNNLYFYTLSPAFNTGFTAGKRLAIETSTARMFVRSSGAAGSAGEVVAIDTDLAKWPLNGSGTNTSVLSRIPVGRDGGSDLIVDQSLHLVITTSQVDNRVDFIDPTANPPALSASQPLPVGGDIGLDAINHRIYLASLGQVQRMDLNPRVLLSPIQVGAESGFPAVVPTESGTPNANRFFIPRTGAGTGIRQFTLDGTASDVTLAHNVGRFLFTAVNRTTKILYALNSGADKTGAASQPSSLSVIDGATSSLVTTIDVGNNGAQVAVNETTNKIYVANTPFGATLAAMRVVDGATNTVTTADTSAVAPSTNFTFQRHLATLCVGSACGTTNKIYALVVNNNDGSSNVGVMNGATNVMTPLSPSVGLSSVNIIRTSSSLNRVFVGNDPGSTADVVVLNGSTDAKITTLTVGAPSEIVGTQSYLAVDETRGRIYAASFYGDDVTVLDATVESGCSPSQPAPSASCYPEIGNASTGRGPTSVVFDEGANRLYVANALDKTLTIIKVTETSGAPLLQVVGTLALPLQPISLAIDPSYPARPTLTYLLVSGSIAEPGAVLIKDDHTAGTLSVSLNHLTQPTSGQTELNADGTVTYEPNPGFTGVDTFTYRVSDGSLVSANNGTVTVTVGQALTLTTTSLPNATKNQPYSLTLGAIGGTPPYYWSIFGSLPGGMTFNQATGVLSTGSGVVQQSGTFQLSVQLRDSSSPQQITGEDFTLLVGPIEIATTFLPNATLNQSYSTTLVAGGSTATPFTWSLAAGSNPLPAGLTLSSAGVLSGTPTQADCNSQTFTVQVADASSATATRTFTLFFNATVRITTTQLRYAVTFENYNFTMGSSCGSGTKTWSTVPANALSALGLAMSSGGSLSGQPRVNGSFPITFQVSDSTGTDTKTVTLNLVGVDQSPSTNTTTNVPFGATTRLAQTLTVGAAGTLKAVRLSGLALISPATTCPITLKIQGVVATTGVPDDTKVLSTTNTTLTSTFITSGIELATPLFLTPDARIAVVISTPAANTCQVTFYSNNDSYLGGDAYTDTGSGWTKPASITDFNFNTMIQNASLVYLTENRGAARSIAISNGTKVLTSSSSGTGEVFNPAGSVFTTFSWQNTRFQPTMTLLNDGRVLVTGGLVNSLASATAEIFDPSTNTSTAVASMSTTRQQHDAVLLGDGRVLVAGGLNSASTTLQSAEIYNPSNNTWTTVASMGSPRNQHTLTRLANGKVLAVGGFGHGTSQPSAEIYDSSTNTWTQTTGSMQIRRGVHTATLLNDGTVLVAGGRTSTGTSLIPAAAEIFDLTTGNFTIAGSMLAPRQVHTATKLSDGSVLFIGGWRRADSLGAPWASSERYVPGTGFVGAPNTIVTRADHGAALLSDGRVALVAATLSTGPSRQANQTLELYDPGTGGSATTTPSVANPNLPDGSLNVLYSAPLTGTGGTGPYSFSIVAPTTLPPGLTLSGNTISGTPTAYGAYYFAVQTTDSAVPTPRSGVQTLRIRINALDITTTSLPTAYVGMTYPGQVNATGVPPVVFSILSGSVPTGLTFTAAGSFTGTPTATGFFNFTVKAVDSVGQVATAPLSIQVNNPLTITTASLNDGLVNSTYGGCIGFTNGVSPFTWMLSGALPRTSAGTLSFQSSTNPCFKALYPQDQLLESGFFQLDVQVTDSASPPQTDAATYFIKVHAAEQRIFDGSPVNPITLDSTRRVAEVFTMESPFSLSGLQLTGLKNCTSGTTITAQIWPVIGAPAVPDESSGFPFVTASVVVGAGGSFNSLLPFPSLFSMKQHARFAAVLSFSGGSCESTNWPTTGEYRGGQGFVSDNGAAWQPLTTLGRTDVAMSTLVIPDGLLHLRGWNNLHKTAPLSGGRILIITSDNFATTSEIYDPAAGTLTATAAMSQVRWSETATALPDGRVVVIAGTASISGVITTLSSVEIFDPAGNGGAGSWTSGGNLLTARSGHTATLLTNGKILVTGGWPANGPILQSAELYDPSTSSSSSTTGSMLAARANHTATLLPSGDILLAGGYSNGSNVSAEVYNPGSGQFTQTSGQMFVFRGEHTASLLTTGADANKVLIIGGSGFYPDPANTSEVYDPVTSMFSARPNLKTPRLRHTTTTLPDGRLLIIGGGTDSAFYNVATSEVEIYNPVAQTFTKVGDLLIDRQNHTANLLSAGPDTGSVFVAGGRGFGDLGQRSAEIVPPTPPDGPMLAPIAMPNGNTGVTYPNVTLTASGGSGSGYSFLVVWGQLPPGLTLNGAVIQGTPTAPGEYWFIVRVTDSISHTGYRSFTIRIDRPAITSTSPLPNATMNTAYNYQFTATGTAPIAWFIDRFSTLPAGLSLSSGGVLSGTPTVSGDYGFQVHAKDATGQEVAIGFNLHINP